ncbi:MAG: D-aminoacyl-tRNA deacylase [Candidatus Fermentibacteraceae bacterium]
MKALVQRVSSAGVTVSGITVSSMGPGLLALVSFSPSDTPGDLDWMRDKLIGLRVFSDTGGLMNLSLTETGGKMLVVSQFTLHADTRKGKRPSFTRAAPPETAGMLYRVFIQKVREAGVEVCEGVFGAHMEVTLVNDGPVTIMVDSPSERA